MNHPGSAGGAVSKLDLVPGAIFETAWASRLIPDSFSVTPCPMGARLGCGSSGLVKAPGSAALIFAGRLQRQGQGPRLTLRFSCSLVGGHPGKLSEQRDFFDRAGLVERLKRCVFASVDEMNPNPYNLLTESIRPEGELCVIRGFY